MQQYGDSSWSQQSLPYSPSSSQYHASPQHPSSSSNKKKDKDKDRSDKSSKRDKGGDGGKHSKRSSTSSQQQQHGQSNSNGALATPPPSLYSTPPSPITPPSPPSPPLPPLRVDLQLRHQALNALLSAAGGESRVAAYWAVIELFLRAQLSKSELDAEVKRLLGDDSISTHNDFFFALLQNAMSDELPSAAQKAKREGEAAGGPGSAGKDKAEKVKREGVEVSKDGLKADGKEGKTDKEKRKEAKRDKAGSPLPSTPTAASAAQSSAAVKTEDSKKESKKRKDGKADKEGRRDKRRERQQEEEAVDWTEQVWPLPPPPQRWSDVSQASVHRETKHIVSAGEYFATLRRERDRRGVRREADGEEGGKEGREWLWAIEESKLGYLRVRSAEEQEDDSSASVNHALALVRSRAQAKRREAEERKDDAADGGGVEEADDSFPDWLNPASSAAYRTGPASLPAMAALRARCVLTAKHGGLKGISESAMSLIHQAMTHYIRMLMAEAIADTAQTVSQPPPAVPSASDQAGSHSDASAMEVAPVSSATSPPAQPAIVSAAAASSFPSSCFAPSLFTPLAPAAVPDTSDSADMQDVPAGSSSSPVQPTADTFMSTSTSNALASGTAASSDAIAAIKTETEAADATSSTDAPPIAPPPIAVRSLSVSVPTSPPSLEAATTSSPTPAMRQAEQQRKAEEERAKEAEDDARIGFPFLIARQPAYRPPPPPPQSQPLLQRPPPIATSASSSASSMRQHSVALGLSDFLECLRQRRSATMRVTDDLPLLLERLIIAQ